jgi:hypothetical protein
MKSLVATLVILATPLCAQAEPRWHASRGGEHLYAYAAPEGGPRRAYGPPPRQGRGGPPPAYVGPPPQGPYQGPPRSPQQRAREDVRAGRRAPLPAVIERVSRQMGGAQYVNVRETRDAYGRPIYVLRFLQRGRIIEVPVDAETGEVQR